MASPGSSSGEQGRKRKALELLEGRKKLPIWSARKKLVRCIAEHDTVILIGETGSGKTTQAPQFVLQCKLAQGCIACTQPRRVAAITVAQRVADESGFELGKEVGYSVRFDDTTSAATRVKYMTDGMLIREAIIDANLKRYSVVFIDEAHERTVNTDVLMGLLKAAQRARKGTSNPLKLVVMSATLDHQVFSSYFDDAQGAYVEGRQFPVQIMYTQVAQDSYVQAAINTVLQIHMDEDDGAILVFLTGQDEIESVQSALQGEADAMLQASASASEGPASPDPALPPGGGAPLKLQVVAIFAAMPAEQQLLAFEPAPPGYRKAILATNIAETSVTIPGVRYVVDTGMVKARAYSAARSLDSLKVVPVSKAQARQRSGRAGRDAPGKCFRLYPEAAFDALAGVTVPEIQRTNLATTVLQLKAAGVHDVLAFDFMEPPPVASLHKALALLYALQAMDSDGELTVLGRQMSRLPLEPKYAAVVLAAARKGCLSEGLGVVSMVSSERVTHTPKGKELEAGSAHRRFQSPHGDHLTFLNIFRAYTATAPKKRNAWCSQNFVNSKSMRNATHIFEQLKGHVDALGLEDTTCLDDYTPIRQALVAGLFSNAAIRQPDKTYKIVSSGQLTALHPSSTLMSKRPACIVFGEVILTTKPYAQCVTAIEPEWLSELVPRAFVSPSA